MKRTEQRRVDQWILCVNRYGGCRLPRTWHGLVQELKGYQSWNGVGGSTYHSAILVRDHWVKKYKCQAQHDISTHQPLIWKLSTIVCCDFSTMRPPISWWHSLDHWRLVEAVRAGISSLLLSQQLTLNNPGKALPRWTKRENLSSVDSTIFKVTSPSASLLKSFLPNTPLAQDQGCPTTAFSHCMAGAAHFGSPCDQGGAPQPYEGQSGHSGHRSQLVTWHIQRKREGVLGETSHRINQDDQLPGWDQVGK